MSESHESELARQDGPPLSVYEDEPAARQANGTITAPTPTRDQATPEYDRALAAEQSVVGALLIGGKWSEISDVARAEDYSPKLRLIIGAIEQLARDGKPHDVTLVSQQLADREHLVAAGGLADLSELARNTPTAANIRAYAIKVRKCAIKARLPAGHRDEEAIARLTRDLADLDSLQTPQQPKAKLIDWLAWKAKAPPQREWWIQDWLSPAPTLCSGAGGIGKSLLWQTIGTSLATGREFLAATTKPLRVLLWMCEDDENEIVRRQDAICAHFEIERTELAGRLHVEPRLGYDNTLIDIVFGKPTFTPNFLELREQVNDLAVDVLVLDNIGQIFGGSENERHQVTVFVNGLQGIVRGRPFAPVLLGHVARSPKSEFSGSAAWENATRMRWYMGTSLPDQQPDDEDEPAQTDVVYLAKRKANYTEKDYRRLSFQRGLLVPESTGGSRFDASYRNDLAERIVLKGLLKLKAAGIHATDAKNSPDYLPKQIFAKGYTEGHSKKELTDAMNRLIGTGKLKRDIVGQYPNRAPRSGLVMVVPT